MAHDRASPRCLCAFVCVFCLCRRDDICFRQESEGKELDMMSSALKEMRKYNVRRRFQVCQRAGAARGAVVCVLGPNVPGGRRAYGVPAL